MKVSTLIKLRKVFFFQAATTVGAKPFYCPDVLSRTRENQSINVSNSLELTLTQT